MHRSFAYVQRASTLSSRRGWLPHAHRQIASTHAPTTSNSQLQLQLQLQARLLQQQRGRQHKSVACRASSVKFSADMQDLLAGALARQSDEVCVWGGGRGSVERWQQLLRCGPVLLLRMKC